MKYRKLGRTALECSEVGLGTWSFASNVYGEVTQEQAVGVVRAALDAGITLFDTAPLYGTPMDDGVAEVILGRALGGNRERVLISTKFGRIASSPGTTHFDAASCAASVEASLRRLGTDRIDILFFHSPFSRDEIDDDVWETLGDLRTAGKIRAVGHSISAFQATEGMARDWACEGRIDVAQVVLSLLNREATGLIGDLSEAGVGVVVREALANGFLSGRVTPDTVFGPRNLNSRYSSHEIAARVEEVERLKFLVRPPMTTMPQAALRWVLDSAGVSTVLAGASAAAEIAECAGVSDLQSFSPQELERARTVHSRDFSAA